MSRFNPDFWEVTLSQENWQQFSTEDHLYYQSPEDAEARASQTAQVESVWPEVRALLEAVLTPRQREVVQLYFFSRMNQRQIAEQLGITQQAAGEHLYGKLRNGRAVGGALRKLRKACARRGVAREKVSQSLP